ncbi:hypothetical protein Sjap_012712 [Stephania japonica]|uniref:Uncharacterized protein n=1 Tax=Stephania japonica TaxID=461633 RepID=A0AAP0IXA9_9MAGN
MQLNELPANMAIMRVLLMVGDDTTRNYQRNPIVCEEIKGDSFFSGEGEFEDKEEQVNFDEVLKFDVDEEDFIEDRVVFRDDGHVIELILQFANSQVLETMVDDGEVDNYLIEKVQNSWKDEEEKKQQQGIAPNNLVVHIVSWGSKGVGLGELPRIVPDGLHGHRHHHSTANQVGEEEKMIEMKIAWETSPVHIRDNSHLVGRDLRVL